MHLPWQALGITKALLMCTVSLDYLYLQPCGVLGSLRGVAQGVRVEEGFQSSSHWHYQTGLAAF